MKKIVVAVVVALVLGLFIGYRATMLHAIPEVSEDGIVYITVFGMTDVYET